MIETACDTESALPVLPIPILPAKEAIRETPVSWAELLLLPGPEKTWMDELRRLVTAGALSSTYGLALGARGGMGSMLHHALSVPLAPLAVCLSATPALVILLALANASIRPLGVARAAAKAFAHTGLILAGISPCVALFMATADQPVSGAIVGSLGLLAAGLVGLRAFSSEMASALDKPSKRVWLAIIVSMLFAAALSWRIWLVSLPALEGAS
jgi:hypothetical protein